MEADIFTHKMDPLVRKELDALQKQFSDLETLVKQFAPALPALAAMEAKLDELLETSGDDTAMDGPKKPEGLAMMPGYVPPSRRKRERAAASTSSAFVEKCVKGAATTKPEGDAA